MACGGRAFVLDVLAMERSSWHNCRRAAGQPNSVFDVDVETPSCVNAKARPRIRAGAWLDARMRRRVALNSSLGLSGKLMCSSVVTGYGTFVCSKDAEFEIRGRRRFEIASAHHVIDEEISAPTLTQQPT